MSVFLAWKRNAALAARAVAVVMLAILLLAARGLALKGEYYSLAAAITEVNAAAERDALVVCDGEPHLAASLFFYQDRPTSWVNATPSGEFAVRHCGIGGDAFLDLGAFRSAWKSPRQVFLITEEAALPAWKLELVLDARQMVPVGSSGTRVAIANRPARR